MTEVKWKMEVAAAVRGIEAEELKIKALKESIAGKILAAEKKIEEHRIMLSNLVNVEQVKLEKR
jgi:hypothetical protein